MDKQLFTQKYSEKQDEINKFLIDIEKIIHRYNYPLEGNIFYKHQTTILCNDFIPKQINLFWSGTMVVKNICEIGLNAGHSAFVLLLGRLFQDDRENKLKTPLNFTIFDIGHHPYTKPSLEYLKNNFSYVNFEYIEGDSKYEIPKWLNNNQEMLEQYDVIHVDGSHEEDSIKNDMRNVVKMCKVNGIIIIDDTDGPQTNKYVELYLKSGFFTEIDIVETRVSLHRIIMKTKSIL
jgi:predicted small metal-binding protein